MLYCGRRQHEPLQHPCAAKSRAAAAQSPVRVLQSPVVPHSLRGEETAEMCESVDGNSKHERRRRSRRVSSAPTRQPRPASCAAPAPAPSRCGFVWLCVALCARRRGQREKERETSKKKKKGSEAVRKPENTEKRELLLGRKREGGCVPHRELWDSPCTFSEAVQGKGERCRVVWRVCLCAKEERRRGMLRRWGTRAGWCRWGRSCS